MSNYHSIKAYWGVKEYFQRFINSAVSGAKQLVPHTGLAASGEAGLPVSID